MYYSFIINLLLLLHFLTFLLWRVLTADVAAVTGR